MSNLTTRKIVLGLLLTLVLAFGVQGTADAFTVTKSSTSDEFILVNSTGNALNRSFTFNITFTTAEVTAGTSTISVTPPSGASNTILTVAGLTDTDGNTANATVTVDPTSTSASATVKYTLAVGSTGLGVKNFTANDSASTVVHTAYGVRADSQNTFSTLIPGTTSPQTGAESSGKEIAVTPNQSWTKVTFSTTSGLLYSQGADNYYVSGSKLTTSLPSGSTTITAYSNNAAAVEVQYRATGNTTATVTAMIPGSVNRASTHKVTVFFDRSVRVERTSGNEQFGQVNSTTLAVANRQQLVHPLVVRVLDGTRGVGQKQGRVTFAVTAGGGVLRYFSASLFDKTALSVQNTNTVTVYTDGQGYAKAYLVLGTNVGANTVTATAAGQSVTFIATATPVVRGGAGLRIDRDHANTTQTPQRNAQYGTLNTPLTMSVRIVDDATVTGTAVPNDVQVNFRITGGRIYLAPATLDLADPDYQTSLTTVTETVGSVNGTAIVYVEVNNGATATVTAQIVGNNTPRGRHVVTYFWGDPNYDDDSGGGRSDPPPPPPPSDTITITPSTIDGEPGEEVTIRVTSSPSGVFATLGSNDFGATRFSPQSDVTPFTSTLLLPVEEGTHSFFATGGVLTAGRASVTVEAELGELSITAIGSPEAGLQTFSISAVDVDGDRAIGTFTARLSGTGFTSRDVEIAGGRGNARVTLPTTARLYTLTVSATGYEDGETPVRIAGTGQQQVADEDEEEVEEEVTVAAEPDSIEITGPSTRSGTVNEELDTPLLVRVLDDDGDGLEGARVFYRVSSGRGRLSARGNGRAIGVVTDSDGYARAVFTPLDGGTITVRANTDDLSATVTFTITTGSASSASGARDSGTGGTPGTISPVVHVVAASRPPMLWVDGGAIYALVGASPQRFASSVDNALNIAVGGGKVYWTEKTGESGGTINSANLNGSDVNELASIMAVPMGIAVDVAGSKLYWTNSRGRIQSANLNGTGITNVIPGGLESPMDLALAGGNAYWTQGNGSVRFVNLRGTKQIRNISTGTDTPGSLVIGGGKVYWTETTGESGGTVNSANLNGTGATPLASILAAPIGIALDGSRSKLYWTNARGRIQSANLDGSGITNVVDGLGSPGELVLSNSIAAPAGAGSSAGSGTTASDSKYDVNGDGSVNNADSDAITVAIAAGATDAKYDVNGDGAVNVFDLVEIIANRDPGAAGAPTLFGMKMSAAQIDSLQEQIDLLIAMNDRSPAALRTLIYLQQLLVTARPEKTQLLANYPNPFNPETWIPYELATDTDVRITIYNTQGVVIRSLQLGHQSAGYYTGRDRAAYWDGRNALGEQVASGLYFYQLETDEMSLMRKMVILK